MAITVFDILAFGVIALCVLISMMRGAVAEVASLATWIVAFLAAKAFAAPFAAIAFKSVEPYPLAFALGFASVFFAAWLMQHFLRSLLTSALSAVGLGGFNRLLGGILGAAKGILLVTLAVLACSFTDLPQTEDWRQSYSAGYFEMLVQLALPYLPAALADKVQYPTT